MRLLTPDRRDELLNAGLGAVIVTAAVLLTAWVALALVLGSIDLAHRLEGWT